MSEPDENKHNLLYFEAPSMRKLYESMDDWQKSNHKRLLSVSVQQDNGKFCCIALTNPSEVIIMDGSSVEGAKVWKGALLCT